MNHHTTADDLFAYKIQGRHAAWNTTDEIGIRDTLERHGITLRAGEIIDDLLDGKEVQFAGVRFVMVNGDAWLTEHGELATEGGPAA